MPKKRIKYTYDEVADVLYSFVGRRGNCITTQVAPGIYIHRNLKSKEIKGFTIVDYMKRKKKGTVKNIPYFPNVQIPY